MKTFAILNITPDSFSDGGIYLDSATALREAAKMIEAGANVIDIGAESTRPNGLSISVDEELMRLKEIVPLLNNLRQGTELKLSIDTRNYQTAQFALDHGFDIINDVSGFVNPLMENLLYIYPSVEFVCMHSLAIPEDRNMNLAHVEDIVLYMTEWAKNCLDRFKSIEERLIIDLGLGFGKTMEQNLELIRAASYFKGFIPKLLYGHSRKQLLGTNTNRPLRKLTAELPKRSSEEKDIATLVVSQFLRTSGVDYIRIHNMQQHMVMRQILEKIYGTNATLAFTECSD